MSNTPDKISRTHFNNIFSWQLDNDESSVSDLEFQDYLDFDCDWIFLYNSKIQNILYYLYTRD